MEKPISWIVIRHEAPAGRFPILLTGTVVALLLAMATLAGCSTSSPSLQRPSIASPAATSGTPSTPAGSSESALTVTGVEYAFQGIPQTVRAGTVVTFANAGKEVHQMIAARRNDGVTASLEELLAMPEAESDMLVTILGGPVASPGETAADTVTLDRPGTWFFVCFIPVGTTNVPALAPGATPNEALMPEGPPHFLQGMVAEVTVTE
jgi:plastocyanin